MNHAITTQEIENIQGMLAFSLVEVERLSEIVQRIGNLPYNPTKYGVELEVHRELWADIQQVMEDYRE